MHPFKNKHILITGASSGIGAELARQLSAVTPYLTLTGRNPDRLREVASQCQGTPTCIIGDLRDAATLAALQTSLQTRPLDIAILNAGTNQTYTPGAEFNAEAFHDLMNTNVSTMVNCTEMVIPFLLKTKGQLVLMSSIAAYGGLPSAAAYCASKATIRSLAHCLDIDLRPKGVPVSCVCPGFVKTPLTDPNPFPMPFLLTVEDGAQRILKGIAKQKHEIHFPKRFSLLMKFIMSLPASWRYRLISAISKSI